jgi:hypothetical protein
MSKENLISHNPDTLLQRPWRGPIEVPELLIPYYEGKVAVEIGFAAGDYIPIWAKHAKEFIGFESFTANMRPWFDMAQGRQDLKRLDNISLLNQEISPEEVPEADFYYGSGLLPPIVEFVTRMKNVGKRGVFAWFSGFAKEDFTPEYKDSLKNIPERIISFDGEDYIDTGHFDQFCYFADESISFNSKELDNRPVHDEMSMTNKCIISIKHL